MELATDTKFESIKWLGNVFFNASNKSLFVQLLIYFINLYMSYSRTTN